MNEPLQNKTYVITGATAGIGLAVAQALVGQGANVIGVGRSQERCLDAEGRLLGIAPQARIAYLCADLSLQSQVRGLAARIAETLAAWGKSDLDGLVNNAGTFTYWQTLTPEGFETQWAVNHLAPFLLTHALLPLLQAAGSAKIVTVSSGSHFSARLNWDDIQLRRRYNGLSAYGQTKLANILFTLALNRRLDALASVRAYAVDPGLVKTDIGLKSASGLASLVWRLRRSGGVEASVPARGILALLAAPTDRQPDAVYWKDGRPKQPSPRALDALAAERLWALSAQMCGLAEHERMEVV